MDGCVQGAQGPHNLEAYLVRLVGGRKKERKAPSSALPRKSTSLGWLCLPIPRVEDVLPLPTPLSLVAALSSGAACLACPSQGRCTRGSCTSLV